MQAVNRSMYGILRAILFLFTLFFINLILQNCSKSDYGTNNNSNSTPGANEVFLQGMAFAPLTKTISVGTTITWTNKENVNHTVTSGVPGAPTGIFDSGSIGHDGTFSYTFTQTGTFKYYCKIHTSMTGTITVQ